jgi:hypothetical protein
VDDGLAAWLRKQIEARRDTAVAALEGSDGNWWRRTDGETGDPVGGLWDGEPDFDVDGDVVSGERPVVFDEGAPSDAQFSHIAFNDPRDAIARCEAELAILDLHVPVRGDDGTGIDGKVCVICSWVNLSEETEGDPYPCKTVRSVGIAYRHLPGYREEWRP